MTIKDDVAAVRADGTKTKRQQDIDIYNLKLTALRDVIVNGKPAPNPIPPVLGRTFTLNGMDIHVNQCAIVSRRGTDGVMVPMLYISVTLTKSSVSVTHQVYYVNPPVIPNSETGNEKQDLIQAASEMISHLPPP